MATPLERRQCGECGTADVKLLRDPDGHPIGKIVQAREDRVVGRGAGTVLLVCRRPTPSHG